MQSHPSQLTIALAALACLVVSILPARAEADGRPVDLIPPQSPYAPSAAPQTLPGIDISNWQHPGGAGINWSQVAGAGHRYVFIKATEGPITCGGNYYTNSWYHRDWADAGAVGMYRGAYHFARPMQPLYSTAIAQARYFTGVTGPMTGSRDLPPVLDFEVTCGLSPSELATWAHIWLDEVERLTGRKPIITTYPSFWSGPMANNTTFGAYPLWFARYGTSSPHPLPAGWNDWTWWQTGQGYVPGIVGDVDLNLFQGDEAWLARFAYGNSPYPTSPIGVHEPPKIAGMDEVIAKGWTLDSDTPDPIEIDVWVDGTLYATVDADGYRFDVGLFFWMWGPYHGFSVPIEGLAPGSHEICVWSHNVGPGINVDLGCQTVTMPTGPPIGTVEQMAWRPGGWQTDGWTLDPDAADSLAISLAVDGTIVRTELADGHRADIGAFFGDWGPAHGYSFRHWPDPGPHELCVIAHGVGPGGDSTLGCRNVNTPGPDPIGGILQLTIDPITSDMQILGWALDTGSTASLDISITIDGFVVTTQSANIHNPAIGHFFTDFGSLHSFDITTPLATGEHEVCVIAHNDGTGSDTTIGCGTQTGP